MDAHALAEPTRRPNWRIAVALSVVPGAGQIYNRQYGKAVRLFLGTAVLIVGAVSVLLWAVGAGPDVYNSLGLVFLLLALGSIAFFLVAFVAGLYVWASAFIDAHDSARALAAGNHPSAISFFHL